VTKRLLFVIII